MGRLITRHAGQVVRQADVAAVVDPVTRPVVGDVGQTDAVVGPETQVVVLVSVPLPFPQTT